MPLKVAVHNFLEAPTLEKNIYVCFPFLLCLLSPFPNSNHSTNQDDEARRRQPSYMCLCMHCKLYANRKENYSVSYELLTSSLLTETLSQLQRNTQVTHFVSVGFLHFMCMYHKCLQQLNLAIFFYTGYLSMHVYKRRFPTADKTKVHTHTLVEYVYGKHIAFCSVVDVAQNISCGCVRVTLSWNFFQVSF